VVGAGVEEVGEKTAMASVEAGVVKIIKAVIL
jgi:hypothetical protein